MSDNIAINANVRNDLGKGASRRLRRIAGLMPAVVYGLDKPAQSISILHKDLLKSTENEAFFSSILDLHVDGAVTPVVLKDLHRHPAKQLILHADFLRVDMNQEIQLHIPLHFINEEQCHGLKMEGGRIQHNLIEIEVSCLPGHLPEYIEVDMTNIHLGEIVHISDLILPEGVKSQALSHGEEHDLPVVSLVAPKGGDEDELDAADAAEAPADQDGEDDEAKPA